MIDAKACTVYTDVSGREEFPCKFDPATKQVFVFVGPDYQPPSFLEEEAYVELPDGTRIDLDECEIVNEYK